METDDLLAKSASEGNTDAFRKIVERYQRLVYAICYNMIKDHQEAENLAQETFIQAYRTLTQYQYRGLKNWISRIAVNKSIDLKRKKAAGIESKVIYLEEMLETGAKQTDDIQEKLIRKEERSRILALCGRLPEKYDKVLKMYYFENKSYQEISQKEGISVKTVESRLYRAKNMLKKYWEEGEENAAF